MSSDEEASYSEGPLEAGATGPLLNPGPRLAAVSSNGSVGPLEGQILCNKNVAGHIVVSAQGGSKEGQVPENTGCGNASLQFGNLYLMSPALLTLFKSLGAENRPYTAKEVWRFLYAYLLKNCHLFDKTDNSFVNCDGDPVGEVFGVRRFHITDVRHLLGKLVYKTGVVPPVAVDIARSATYNGVCKDPPGCSTEVAGSAPSLYDKPVKKQNLVHVVLAEDDLPVSNSDAETEYSRQGYETAVCRNSESEEGMSEDLDDQPDFVEYEVASDASSSEKTLSDEDSELEDVELAVVTLMYKESKEDEVFWGDDDSDSESTSAGNSDIDSGLDLAKEKWACLKCNKENKSFMRYCEKCWQQRKDWLPDCPKGKKRRKPRPKKPRKPRPKKSKKSRIPQNGLKARAPLESTSVWYSTDGSQECEYIDAEGNSKNEVTLAEVEESKTRLSRTLSDASTVSIDEVLKVMSAEERASGSRIPQEAGCSQDFGIGMSRESFSEATQSRSAGGVSAKCSELKVENRKEYNNKSACEKSVLLERDNKFSEDSSNSAKSKVREESALPSTSYAKHNRETGLLKTESEPVQKPLKSKHSAEVFVATCIKTSRSAGAQPEEESLGESDEENPKDEAESKLEFLLSEEGKKWIGIPDSNPDKSDFPNFTDISARRLCSLCYIRPKNGIVVHGRNSHQFSCYPCAKRLLDSKMRCPICRRKIHMVTKNVVV